MTRAAIYARLSQQRKDEKGNESTSIDRQVKVCRALCKARGWRVAKVYKDVDLSGYKPGIVRPEWERLRADVEAGEVEAVVVFATSRAGRRTVDTLRLVELCQERGVPFMSATEPFDTSTPTGGVLVTLLAGIAQAESQARSDRITVWHEEQATAGKPVGGGHRPFGYHADKVTVEESEAVLVKDAAERVLAGASLRSIAKSWNADGVTATSGKPWTVHSLRRLLMSPRIAGLREHQGEAVADAVWPPIIDRATHERLRAILGDPRRSTRTSPAARSYLLTGFATCSLCGQKLIARPKDGRRSMVCATGVGLGGCGGIRVQAEPLEDLVSAVLFERLSSPIIAKAFERAAAHEVDDADAVRELEADRNALDELVHDRYVRRIIDHGAFVAADRELRERIAATERQLAAVDRRVLLAVSDIRDRWETADLTQRREVVGLFVESVIVGPAIRGRNVFDPDRVSISWRT